MREEKRRRTKVEEYTVYIAKDGKTFTSQKECEVHEMILDGKAKVCPDCHGEKFRDVIIREFDPMWHEGGYRFVERTEYKKWPTCKGKGYLVKKEKWE